MSEDHLVEYPFDPKFFPEENEFRLIHQKLADIVESESKRIMSQRNEVLEAFIAKYGFEPERFVQVEQKMENGLSRWFVHRRTDEDMADMAEKFKKEGI
jgi:hypothetical protein